MSDDTLEQLLHHNGALAPALKGNDTDGIPKVDKARALLRLKRAAIAVDAKNLPCTDKLVFEIDTGDSEPIAEKPRRYPAKQVEFINSTVQQLKLRGQVRPSSSPWASNLVRGGCG